MGQFVWLGVAVIMGVTEACSLTLVTVWFVIGALAAFVASFLGATLAWQIVVFGVVSLACLLLLRPLALKHRSIGKSLEASPIGSQGLVVERIAGASELGRVQTDDHMTWAALSADGTPIEEGERVNVVDQVSVKLVVERIGK